MSEPRCPPKDNRRKSSSHTTTFPKNNWTKETHPNSIQQTNSRFYRQACDNEHEIKYLGAKTSEESVDENYPNESVYVNVAPKADSTAIREKNSRLSGYCGMYSPETISAVQKLRKLKELQMKRDISDRYYTQAMKRLISDYYYESRTMAQPLSPRVKLQSASFHPFPGMRMKNSLEPCGTMTTITKLNCGCIQETTRQIFTTARGRVQRRNCSQSQDEVLLNSTSLSPQEHIFSTIEPRSDRPRVKRTVAEPRVYSKIPPGGDRACETETENETRNDADEQNMKRVPRASSPCRKFSDTSVGSV